MNRIGLEEISISGVWLHKRGNNVIVEVERKLANGTFQWFEVIAEPSDGEYSHIVEPEKIRSLYWNERKETAQ
jgi:hypothetical protein